MMEKERQANSETPTQATPNTPDTPLPTHQQEPVIDQGSLGYGQGMQYQYAEPPQPTQEMTRFRLEQLQSRRLDRVRRQVKSQLDVTTRLSRVEIQQKALRPSTQRTLTQASLPTAAEVDEANAVALADPLYEADEKQDTGSIRRVRLKRATIILSGAFIVSRVLGLLRSTLLATVLGGSSLYADAFINAFIIPDTIFNIVAGGALSSAFIPIFTKRMSVERNEQSAWHIANTALTLATTVMIVIALLAMIFTPQLVSIYNSARPDTTPIIVDLVRIMLFQVVILGAGTITSAILNAQQNFMVPALGTVLYNVGIIAGLMPGYILYMTGNKNDAFTIKAAAVGVVIGALLQVAIQIPALIRGGMKIRLSFDWRNSEVRQIGRQMLPRIFNAIMLSSSVFVDAALIGFLSVAAASNVKLDGLRYESVQAMSLMQLPLGLFGMAISTAAFPTLAEFASRGQPDRVRGLILETLRSIVFLSVPAAIGLIILGLPLIEVLLVHGEFTIHNAFETSIPLALFALGLPGFAAVEILTRSFYAMRDSRTPVFISILQFMLKIALSIVLITPFTVVFGVIWGMGSLALATTIASTLEAIVLFLLLHNRLDKMIDRPLASFAARVLLATLGMALAIGLVRWLLDMGLNTTDPHSTFFEGLWGFVARAVKLTIEVTMGAFIYLHLARFLNIKELGPIQRLLDRFKLAWLA